MMQERSTQAATERARDVETPEVLHHQRVSTFSSLAHPNYRYLWTGTLFMSLGQWIQQVTLGYYMYDLTGSSVLLGVLQTGRALSLIHISEPTRQAEISYAVFC